MCGYCLYAGVSGDMFKSYPIIIADICVFYICRYEWRQTTCLCCILMQACVETCLDRTIAETCGCYRSEYLLYYNDEVLSELPECASNTTREYFSILLSTTIIQLNHEYVLLNYWMCLQYVTRKCLAKTPK